MSIRRQLELVADFSAGQERHALPCVNDTWHGSSGDDSRQPRFPLGFTYVAAGAPLMARPLPVVAGAGCVCGGAAAPPSPAAAAGAVLPSPAAAPPSPATATTPAAAASPPAWGGACCAAGSCTCAAPRPGFATAGGDTQRSLPVAGGSSSEGAAAGAAGGEGLAGNGGEGCGEGLAGVGDGDGSGDGDGDGGGNSDGDGDGGEGHVQALRECGPACACAAAPDRCPLRGTQRGVGARLELVWARGGAKGWGVRAAQGIIARGR
ncbi:hypothetical protein FOA52_007319 [Chlamydomonas sp. UWO 241]|nr:hypothetical protein FOA52_007319 [Chlamydomonas sp. UWO 241]